MSTIKHARQKTIGTNPLDHYLSMQQVTQQEEQHQQVSHEQLSPSSVSITQEDTKKISTELVMQESIPEKIQEQQIVIPEVAQETTPERKAECTTSVHKQVLQSTADAETEDIVTQILQKEDMQGPKQRITLHVSQELLEKVKNAVFWEPGLTLAGFAHYALEKAVEQFEHERGAPFPDRKTRRLRGGRPMK